MPNLYRLHYAPKIDSNWAVTPGACVEMAGFMGDQFGNLRSMRMDGGQGFALTDDDAQYGEVFQQTNGGARFLVFRDTDIDEYDSSGTRTNRLTGVSAGTWSAAAWGDQIIACNYTHATQSSTGAGFSALSGAPQARYVAANVNFVLFARLENEASFPYADGVWWGGIRNPNTYAPSQATQAGQQRLLDTPGPITGIAAFRDEFIVCKKDAVYRGRYIGPPYVFSWQVIAKGIGCTGRNFAECDGKLYFLDYNGVYAYDGAGISEVSKAMWTPVDVSPDSGTTLQCTRDGVLWLLSSISELSQQTMYAYSYNARTGIWTRAGATGTAVDPGYPAVVRGSAAALYAFKPAWGVYPGFVWITNDATSSKCTLAYPGGAADVTLSLLTGLIGGEHESAPTASRVYLRFPVGSGSSPVNTGTMRGYRTERETSTDSATLTWNDTMQTLDGVRQANYKDVSVTFSTGKLIICAGLGLEYKPGGKR